MADGVLRQAAAPALHVGVDDLGQRAAEGLADLGDGERDQVVVVALQVGLLAGPADRGAQVHDVVGGARRSRPTCGS